MSLRYQISQTEIWENVYLCKYMHLIATIVWENISLSMNFNLNWELQKASRKQTIKKSESVE